MEIFKAYWLRFWHCLYNTFTGFMAGEDHRMVNQWTYDQISHIACACGKVFYHRKFIDIYNEVHKTDIKAQVIVGTAYCKEDEYTEKEKQIREKFKLTDMKKVTVNGRKGHTTGIIPHSDGKYPVWYDDGAPFPDFVLADQVTFI